MHATPLISILLIKVSEAANELYFSKPLYNTVRLKTKLSIFKTKPQQNSNKTTTKTQQKQNIQSKQNTAKQNFCDFVVNHT